MAITPQHVGREKSQYRRHDPVDFGELLTVAVRRPRVCNLGGYKLGDDATVIEFVCFILRDRELRASGCGFVGTVPPGLCSLSGLALSNNRLSGSLPSYLWSCPMLT